SAQVEREKTPGEREGHVQEHEQGVTRGAEGHEEEREDDADGDGHDDAEPLSGPFEVLELAAPAHPVAWGQRHGVRESRLRLRDEAALIPRPDIGADRDLTLV